jgi:hypothetical protein
MASFKKFQGIKYSEWDRNSLKHFVDRDLLEFMLNPLPEYPRELLLEWRTLGLTVKSGAKSGQVKDPKSTYGVFGLPWSVDVDGTSVEGPQGLSSLQKMALLQTWCAHPEVRVSDMILDPLDWDHIPTPITAAETGLEVPFEEPIRDPLKMPWEL